MSARRAPAAEEKPKGLLHYIGLALSGALLVIVIAIAILAIVIPAVSGGSALTVLTQSMEPKLPPGTLIIIHPVTPADIKVGNVITYQIKSNQPEVVSHRVISKSTDTHGDVTFITKGDNNSLADTPAVRPVQIKGVLWYSIPWLGYVNTLSGGEGSRALLIPVVAGLLFVYAAYMVVSSIVGSRRKRFAAAVAAASAPDAAAGIAAAGAAPVSVTSSAVVPDPAEAEHVVAVKVSVEPAAVEPAVVVPAAVELPAVVAPPIARPLGGVPSRPVAATPSPRAFDRAERFTPIVDTPPSAEFLEWARQKWAVRDRAESSVEAPSETPGTTSPPEPDAPEHA